MVLHQNDLLPVFCVLHNLPPRRNNYHTDQEVHHLFDHLQNIFLVVRLLQFVKPRLHIAKDLLPILSNDLLHIVLDLHNHLNSLNSCFVKIIF